MPSLPIIDQFRTEIAKELTERIMPFWLEKTPDWENGGFYGRIANDLRVDRQAEKGCILYSRILWTFAAAYRQLRDKRYLAAATRAYEYLRRFFWDDQYSGLYFMVDYRGRVTQPHKQTYNLAFGIYGFSEYYRATGSIGSLDYAIGLFRLIEEHCYDDTHQGYFEAFSRDWQLAADMRLSSKDLNEKKSMNTHLHLVEAYTNLLGVWENDLLRERLAELVQVMLTHIIDPVTGHFKLFFDDDWNSKLNDISLGHDIEGSWLLYKAVLALGDSGLIASVSALAARIAQRVYEVGLDAEAGGLYNELNPDESVAETLKVWWPQCEAMVGFLNAFELTGEEHFWQAAQGIWQFCKQALLDTEHGEWFGEVSRDGKPNEAYEKVGPWKCPYHNGRACLEILSRLDGTRFETGVVSG